MRTIKCKANVFSTLFNQGMGMMKVTVCNNLFKRILTFLLINSFIISPLLSLPNTYGDTKAPVKKASKSALTKEINEDDPIQKAQFLEVLSDSNLKTFQGLFHRVEILKIASNKYLKGDSKKDFLSKIDSIRSELTKHAGVLEKNHTIALLEFNKQVAEYLTSVIKKQLKNIQPFVFNYTPKKSEPSIEELLDNVGVLEKHLKAFEDEFQNLGVSTFQRWGRSLSSINQKLHIGSTAKTLFIAFAALCYLHYDLKRRPKKSDDTDLLTTLLMQQAGKLSELEARMNNPQQGNVSQQPQQQAQQPQQVQQTTQDAITPDTGQQLPSQNNNNNAPAITVVPTTSIPQNVTPQPGRWDRIKPYWQFFDKRIIGLKPRLKPFRDEDGYPSVYVDEPGTGLFGFIDTVYRPVLKALGLATALKVGSDKFTTWVNDWKALHKSPAGFVNIDKVLGNKEQTVNPLEELFILRALERIHPRLTLKDIIGLEDQKKEIAPIINYVLNPNMFNATNTSIEMGVLLYGPTRTGKSLFAEAMAGTLMYMYGKELSFFKIKCSELRGIMGIDKILETLDKLPGIKIAFFDEMDLLNLQRDGDKTMLSDFLNNMGKHNIIIIGATYRIDHIDQALLQSGRFGKRIAFVKPPLHTRVEFFKNKLSKMNILDDSLDLQRLGIETDNCSFGDLESILNDAVAQATQQRQKIAYQHFDTALDTFKRNITSLVIPLPEAERRLIATHLCGHALGFELLQTSESLHKLTTLPIKKHISEEKVWLSDLQSPKRITYFGDVFTLHKTNTGGFDTYEQKINMVKVLLAGHVAEKVMLGSTSYSYHNEDNEKARFILESLVFKGIKKDNISKKECNKKMEEVMALFEKYEQETTEFIIANKDKLVKMIDAILVRQTLTQEDVQKLLGTPQSTPMAAPAA